MNIICNCLTITGSVWIKPVALNMAKNRLLFYSRPVYVSTNRIENRKQLEYGWTHDSHFPLVIYAYISSSHWKVVIDCHRLILYRVFAHHWSFLGNVTDTNTSMTWNKSVHINNQSFAQTKLLALMIGRRSIAKRSTSGCASYGSRMLCHSRWISMQMS